MEDKMLKNRFKERYNNLRMSFKSYVEPWYNDKKAKYSSPSMGQPVKLGVLEFMYKYCATPYEIDYEKYTDVCKSLNVKQLVDVGEHLKGLYQDLTNYLYKKQFMDCVKYEDNSLVLYSYRIGNTISLAYKKQNGVYYDFHSRLELAIPESCFSVSHNALTESGNIVSIHILERKQRRNSK